MNASNLLRSVLKPRNLPTSPEEGSGKISTPRLSTSPVKERTTPHPTTRPVRTVAGTPAKRPDLAPSSTKRCLCAPTTHAGSFRCRLHRLSASQTSMTAAAKKSSSQLPTSKSKSAAIRTQEPTPGTPAVAAQKSHDPNKRCEGKASMLSRVATIEDAENGTRPENEVMATQKGTPTAILAKDSKGSTKNVIKLCKK